MTTDGTVRGWNKLTPEPKAKPVAEGCRCQFCKFPRFVMAFIDYTSQLVAGSPALERFKGELKDIAGLSPTPAQPELPAPVAEEPLPFAPGPCAGVGAEDERDRLRALAGLNPIVDRAAS